MGRALTSVTTKANARALAHAAWVVGMACCTLLLRGCKPPAAPPLLASSCARDPVLELLLFGPEGGWVAQVGKCGWAAGWGGRHWRAGSLVPGWREHAAEQGPLHSACFVAEARAPSCKTREPAGSES